MKISEDHISADGGYYIFEYIDADTFRFLDRARCRQAYGMCFFGDELVITSRGAEKWNLVGGTIESGEPFEDALKRSVRKYLNCEAENITPIGYLRLTDMLDGKEVFQLHYACSVKIDESRLSENIKLIDPAEYKTYFDWGKIGERIIERALEIKKRF